MDKNVLLSKIVANPTENTWSQAYSTLNLYIVLSITSQEPDENIVTAGKELLERLQREYFSLDEKHLDNIKKSVENAIEPVDSKKTVSLVLATISDTFLYIVLASKGSVILRRHGKVAEIANGEEGVVSAFSGEIKNEDVVILETDSFSQKIGVEKLSETLDHLTVSEISENLAPAIHNEPIGSEAAIILQYKDVSVEATAVIDTPTPTQDEETENKTTVIPDAHPAIDESEVDDHINNAPPKIALPALGKKKLIIFAIIALAVVLVGSIIVDRSRQENAKANETLAGVLEPGQKKFDEAEALLSLNKGLALEEFEELKSTLEIERGKFKQDSEQRKKLDEFIGRVEGKIGEIGGGATVSNQKQIFENVEIVQYKDGTLVAAATDGKVSILTKDGEADDEIETDNKNIKAMSADTTSIFVLGDEGISKITKSSGAKSVIVDNPEATAALDNFGSNLYGLNTKDKTVDKYSGSSYTKGEYFTEDVTLSDPVSMAIDGSIWIIDDGKIRKFTRGKEDSFSITGLSKDLNEKSTIFTSTDYTNLYILDPQNMRIIVITKSGQVENQINWKDLSDATSIAVDEEENTVYAVISGNLYSFSLE